MYFQLKICQAKVIIYFFKCNVNNSFEFGVNNVTCKYILNSSMPVDWLSDCKITNKSIMYWFQFE